MNAQKTALSTSITLALGMVSYTAQANLTSSTSLTFALGTLQTVACINGTTPPCNNNSFNVTDIVGSYFSMDVKGDGVNPSDKSPIGSFGGLHIGSTQLASGAHSGSINGSESPSIDNPWAFSSNTGMSQTTAPTTVASTGSTSGGNMSAVLNLAWSITWNSIANIPMTPTSPVTVVCDTTSCSASSNYTLDGAYHVAGAGFTSVPYTVHLEGAVSSFTVLPVPAAAWLFGSGLAGLIGVARRRKAI